MWKFKAKAYLGLNQDRGMICVLGDLVAALTNIKSGTECGVYVMLFLPVK